MNPGTRLLLLCLALAAILFGCSQPHGRDLSAPYWILDRNVPQLEYVYRNPTDGHMEYLGWVFQDVGASNEWVAVYYSGTGIAVRTQYFHTEREARQAIENWYGKGPR